jgi:hypothetical protein
LLTSLWGFAGLDLLDRLDVLENKRQNIIDWLYGNLINTDIPATAPSATGPLEIGEHNKKNFQQKIYLK